MENTLQTTIAFILQRNVRGRVKFRLNSYLSKQKNIYDSLVSYLNHGEYVSTVYYFVDTRHMCIQGREYLFFYWTV